MAKFEIKDSHQGHEFTWECSLRPSSSPAAPKVTCPQCHGNCQGRGGFHQLDDPVDCWRCHNSGVVGDPLFRWDPAPPQELVDRLHRVWREYWNERMNDEFALTSPETEK